jgi:hypothetical protein
MYEALKSKTETIAEKYADLIEKRLNMALNDEADMCDAMEQIEGGIKMLGYLVTALDRMNRISPSND